jgi:DUF2075 family protein
MPFRILKHTKDGHKIYVNDNEGIPMEWEQIEHAMLYAKLFESSSKHGSIYVVEGVGKRKEENDTTVA